MPFLDITAKIRRPLHVVTRLAILALVLLWFFALAVYVRSKFRSDEVGIVVHERCLGIAVEGGEFYLHLQWPWHAARQIEWTNGPTVPDDQTIPNIFGPNCDWDWTQLWKNWVKGGFGFRATERCFGYHSKEGMPMAANWFVSQANNRFADNGDSIAKVNALVLWIPVWFLPLIFALPPAIWLLQSSVLYLRDHRRGRKGLCRNCRYDLRASPASCPECGKAPAKLGDHALEWKIAFASLGILLLAAEISLRWLENS